MFPGEYVTPSIRLVRLLGRGGMGAVWVAEHEKLHTEVVVKFILGSEAADPDARARFEREATLAAQAKSPHVVQIFDHGVTDAGLPYIAMERLQGEDLGTRLERELRISPPVFAEWFRQICAGIGRAHSRGIVHRDLKPENIFLCNEDGEVLVKLLDFGIAKDSGMRGSGATLSGAMLGTVHFMSPEQAMGDAEVDARSDLWSLGVLAFYCLTGVLPFQGEALGAIVVHITSSEPPAPSSVAAGIPRTVDLWMKKALAKDPAQRFQNARDMATSLYEAVLGFQAARPYDFGDTHASLRAVDVPRQPTTLTPATGHGPLEGTSSARSRLLPLAGLSLIVVASTLVFLGPTLGRAFRGEGPDGTVTRIEALSPAVAEPEPVHSKPEVLQLKDLEEEEPSAATAPARKTPRTARTKPPVAPDAKRGPGPSSPKDASGPKRDLSMKLE